MPRAAKPKKLLAAAGYAGVLRDLKAVLARGLASAEREMEYQRALTYWTLGREIAKHIDDPVLNPPTGPGLILRLSEDLNLSKRTLRTALRFARLYKRPKRRSRLNWTHYVYLVRVDDDRKRAALEKKIVSGAIGLTDLRHLVTKVNRSSADDSPAALQERRGVLYLYKVREYSDRHTSGRHLEIDLGFDVGIDIPPRSGPALSRGHLIVSSKGAGGAYTYRRVTAKTEGLYTYRAGVLRVIDGDTLLTRVDLGFGARTRQRLRLKGIDAPEIKTAAGERAKRFLEARLKNCPSVIIQTHNSDKYDRYLVDVWLPKKPATGARRQAADGLIYLNRLLVDTGHARVWAG